jgi:hypothetical protein
LRREMQNLSRGAAVAIDAIATSQSKRTALSRDFRRA